MKFTLRQLAVFLATAHYENISRAAESLAMSQSAASGALQDLEQRHSTQLFDRVGKRLQLNAHGHALRPLAESLMSQATEVEAALEQRETAGKLKVGATLTIGNYVAIPILVQFMSDYPAIDVGLHVANTAHIVQEVLDYEMDIGLIEGEYSHNDLSVTPWRADELVAFCSPDHPFAKLDVLGDEEILSARWILRETGSGTRQAFDRAMHGILAELQVHLELEHTEAIKRAVEANMGVGCLSRIALVEAFQRGNLVPLTIPDRDMHRQFYLVLHKRKYRSASLQRWIDACENYRLPE